ncbi:MAG: HAD family hydrolase [Verrucomicrobiota bacterium]
MMVKAVFFDLDDTLVVDEAVSGETLQETARQAALRHGAEAGRFARDASRHAKSLWLAGPSHSFCRAIGISAFECLWGKFAGGAEDLRALREWAEAFRPEVFDQALREQLIESPGGARDLADCFSRERRLRQRLMPDARETLTRLSAGYALGMLTNGAPDLQREKIAASGLGGFFQAIAVSGEHGIGKPAREIFQRLAAELGVETPQAVMVGNSLERDIAGAKNAGMVSIWIKIPGSEEPADVEPDFTITGLAELPAVLEKLETSHRGC